MTLGSQLRNDTVLVNRYVVLRLLGSGKFGTAYLIEDRNVDLHHDHRFKVVKQIVVGDSFSPGETVEAMKEARVLSRLDNPSILRMFDRFADGNFFCLVTEYCEGGDLEKVIIKHKKEGSRIAESQILDWFCEIIIAVQYMHKRRILHRDLKPSNIFLCRGHCKIGDFGISRILMGTMDMATTWTGTPYYMSPEVLKHVGYNEKSDIWSCGVILYELCALQHAFDGVSLMSVMYKITAGFVEPLPVHYSEEISALIQRLLLRDEGKRLSANQVVTSSIIDSHLQKMLLRVDSEWEAAIDVAINIAKEEFIPSNDSVPNDKLMENIFDSSTTERPKSALLNNIDEETVVQKESTGTTDSGVDLIAQYKACVSDDTYFEDTLMNSMGLSRVGTITDSTAFKKSDAGYGSADGMNTSPDDRPISVNHKTFDELLEAQIKEDIYHQQPGKIPHKPFVPLKKGRGKMAYERKPEKLKSVKKSKKVNKKKRVKKRDEVDGAVDLEATELDYMKDEFESTDAESDNSLEEEDNKQDDDVLSRSDSYDETPVIYNDVYTPTVRDQKIENMKRDAIKRLGKEYFDKVYDIVKRLRANNESEAKIKDKCMKITKKQNDIFLVDQLVFLESL